MKFSKLYYWLFLFLALPMLFLQNIGCDKEYSNEGADTSAFITNGPIDSTIIDDTTKIFAFCNGCNPSDELTVGSWNFKTDNSYVCGHTTNSGFFAGDTKKDITFFGPSTCSLDTGLVIGAFFSLPLDQDRYNLTTTQVEFYYYDHNAPKDIFISQPQKTLTVNIQSFIYQTHIATGTFRGTVFKANGDTAFISDGKFKVFIK